MGARMVHFSGVHNARDFGGLVATDGRMLQGGQLFRAAALHGITREGIAQMQMLGITDVIDLRSTSEVRRDPEDFLAASGFQLHHLPMLDYLRSSISNQSFVFPASMHALYTGILQRHQNEFGEIFKKIDHAEGGVLFHCTAGKDRTGITAMLVLSALGVSAELIAQDYALSRPKEVDRDKWKNSPSFLFEANEQTMYDLLDWVSMQYGSVAEYLQQAGVTPQQLERLQGRLLEGTDMITR